MARIAGIDLPREKRVEIGLTYIFGIGRKSANDILKMAGVNPDTRVKDLTEDQEAALREVIDKNYTIEGDLRREVALNIKRLTEIGARHSVVADKDILKSVVKGVTHVQLAGDVRRGNDYRIGLFL